ncbi:MAG TPA: hypothetical protein VL500_06430 [Candidatus Eisenbacteria bacterium]|jgi:hypothetical protein|nr:hypothetical protein [Candidatus Eisenbacteria bacterium]
MNQEDPGGLAAALARLEALAARPDDRSCEEVVREVMAALPCLKLTPMTPFREGLGRLRERLRRERRPDTARMDGMLAALELLSEEHDAYIAHLRCLRCGIHRTTFHVVMRCLREGEERVCEQCRDERLDRGWSILTTEDFYAWCYACQQQKRPMYCVGPAPDPMVLKVCDRCAADLRPAGFRPAVTTVHSA